MQIWYFCVNFLAVLLSRQPFLWVEPELEPYWKTLEWFRSRSRGIWLELEPSLWPSSGSTLNLCLIIHENYMELTINWCLFWSKHKIWPTCTGTCVRTYFRQFVVSFKKLENYVLFYQEPELELAPDKKFP